MKIVIMVCFILLWLYILRVLKKAELHAWRFLWGSVGIFIIMMLTLQPIVTQPLARCVSALAGVIGNITGGFSSYFKYGIIFIQSAGKSLTLQVDFECSGVIEIMAYLSLLAFFNVYKLSEKIIAGIIGFSYIMVCNALRIALICVVVQYFGTDSYYIVHTFIGRIFFYGLSVLLYFYVFTKPQILKMKVGNFSYGNNGKSN